MADTPPFSCTGITLASPKRPARSLATPGLTTRSHPLDIALAWTAFPDLKTRPAFPAFIPITFPGFPMRHNTRLEFLVPILDNEGAPFPDTAFATFEDFLLDIAGGYTFRGEVDGAWRAPDGRVFRDTSRSYVTSVSEARADEIAASIDHEVRRRFRQEATFLEQLPTRALAF